VKKIILIIVLAAMSQGVFLFAQNTSFRHESDFYYFNFSIERVFAHRLGYVVIYRNGSNQISRTYLPLDWFNAMGGKGAVAYLGSGREWPSMTVYYQNGEFSHVLLRLRRERAHQTWGVIPLNANIDEYFRDIEEVRLEF
jgi:hypothetical protein